MQSPPRTRLKTEPDRAKLADLVRSELHHLCVAFYAGHYTPGSVTAIPYVAASVMLLRALFRERRRTAERDRDRLSEAPSDVMREFWPGIKRLLAKHCQPGLLVASGGVTSGNADGSAARRNG